VSKVCFFLAPVEAFVEPTVVVPNIGGKTNWHLWLKARHNWRDLFIKWLHEPYDMGDLSDSEAPTGESDEDDGEDDHSVPSSESDEEEEGSDSEEDDINSEAEALLDAN
jgi:hypothetical protein